MQVIILQVRIEKLHLMTNMGILVPYEFETESTHGERGVHKA